MIRVLGIYLEIKEYMLQKALDCVSNMTKNTVYLDYRHYSLSIILYVIN